VFWKAWVDLQEPELRGGGQALRRGPVAAVLVVQGDATMDEALNAIKRFQEINRALMTKRGVERVRFYLNRLTSGFWNQRDRGLRERV
jgi:hypothetical protein